MLVASLLIHLTILGGCFVTITLSAIVLTRLRNTTPACTLTPYTRPYLRLCTMSSLTLGIITVATILFLSFGVTPVDMVYAMVHLRMPIAVNRQLLVIGVGLQVILRLVCKTYGILDVRWRLFPHRRAENRGTGSQDTLPTDAADSSIHHPELLDPKSLTPQGGTKIP